MDKRQILIYVKTWEKHHHMLKRLKVGPLYVNIDKAHWTEQ